MVVFLQLSCMRDKESLEASKSDLFQNTIIKSQFFKIDPTKDTVIVGNKGTKIIIYKNTFINSKGNVIQGEINFELLEALTFEDMILANLTTISNGTLLETDGMIYINASYKDEIITINKKKPLYIEIPTHSKKPSMLVYKGVRDSVGNMNWINPKELDKFLVPIDLNLLDFYRKVLILERPNI